MKKLVLFCALFFMVVGLSLSAKKLPQKQINVQLYSMRDLIGDAQKYAQNHVSVFKQLKELGYTDVEAANYGDGKFYGISPEQYKSDVEAAGLYPLSSHATRGLSDEEIKNHDFTEAMKWWDQCIAAHKAAGIKYLITPWGNVPKNLKDAQTVCDYHNAIGKKCNAAGLRYGYHTHSHEFQKVEGQAWIEYMMNHIAPENMFWQMDVYWAVMAKESPVQWIKKFPGRFLLLHIKDKYEVGASGMVNYGAIFNNAEIAGLKSFVIELEGTDGSIDIMEGIKRSADYVRSSDFVKSAYYKK